MFKRKKILFPGAFKCMENFQGKDRFKCNLRVTNIKNVYIFLQATVSFCLQETCVNNSTCDFWRIVAVVATKVSQKLNTLFWIIRCEYVTSKFASHSCSYSHSFSQSSYLILFAENMNRTLVFALVHVYEAFF